MLWYEALILGLVQGLTEFLPISSSGHLVLFPKLFNFSPQPLVFDVILHLGTVLALIVYFWHDLIEIFGEFYKIFVWHCFKASYSGQKRFLGSSISTEAVLGGYILIGSIPAALFGFFLENYIEGVFRSIISVAVFLILGSLLLVIAEVKGNKDSNSSTSFENESSDVNVKTEKKLSITKVLGIGVFQALALFPGFSRSGATISGGMLFGLTRTQAARFSFLLSIPIVLGAASFKIVDTINTDLASIGILPLVVGFFTSFFVGFLAIDFLLKFVRNRSLYVFVVYRLVLAFVLVFTYFL